MALWSTPTPHGPPGLINRFLIISIQHSVSDAVDESAVCSGSTYGKNSPLIFDGNISFDLSPSHH